MDSVHAGCKRSLQAAYSWQLTAGSWPLRGKKTGQCKQRSSSIPKTVPCFVLISQDCQQVLVRNCSSVRSQIISVVPWSFTTGPNMDLLNTLLLNARERLGCSGLRNLGDLSQMRQETLEKRLAGAQHRLTVRNTLSIYTAWLWEKAYAMSPKNLHHVMEKWCMYLWGIGCTREMARVAWTQAQTMLGPMPVTRSSPEGALHLKVGSAITNQFPTIPNTKRKLVVLEESSGSCEQAVPRTDHQHALSPSAKRQKTSHVGPSMYESPFRQLVPKFPPSMPFERRDYLSPSPRTKIANSHAFEHATRRTQEEKSEPPWRRDNFKFDFGRECEQFV